MTENVAIDTNLGEIHGRNGIYLDKLMQTFSPNQLTFYGEINARLCTNYSRKYRWISYELVFHSIQAFDCLELELCRLKVESSFDERYDSELLGELNLDNKKYHHYVLSTYDYVYQIVATDYKLNIIGTR